MLSYSVLCINKKFFRAEAFSENLTNLPKQTPAKKLKTF